MSQNSLIKFSVGRGGRNLPDDVRVAQQLLNRVDVPGVPPLIIDGRMGARTIDRIQAFQRTIRLAKPDGLIEPGGKTVTALMNDSGTPATVQNKVSLDSTKQWDGDSAQWTQEKKLQSMNPDLQTKISAVLESLKQKGFKPKIFYGWRSIGVQKKLYDAGKSKVKFSFHNAQKPDGTPNSYAADIIDERFAWSAQADSSGFWKTLGEESKKQGLYWGGDWSFYDPAHVQLVDNPQLSQVKKDSGL